MARPKPYRPPTSITLAGIPVRRELVEWLADQLPDEPAGGRLRRALVNDTRIVGLEVAEREQDPPRWTIRPLALPSSAECCSANTNGSGARGWRKLTAPDLIGGARCTLSL